MSPPLTFPNINVSNITWDGASWAGSPIIERNTMSKQVTAVQELQDLGEGAKVIVRTDGTQDTTTWTVDEGHLCKEGVRVVFAGFAQSITVGNVFLPGDHHVGQIFSNAVTFYKIMARDGDDWVIASCDTHGAAKNLECYVGQPLGLGNDRQEYVGNDILEPAWDMAFRLFLAETTSARLQAILDSGRIPTDQTYAVTVTVLGNVGVQPTNTQAKRLVGDNTIEVLGAGSTDVAYVKTLTLEKDSAWGCACDQVTDADITAPGDITSWSVTGCAPTEEGVESTVHAAA